MDVSFHTIELPLPGTTGGAGVPEMVHLVPSGTFSGVDGRGPYTLANAQAVIDASMRAGHLAIDENHATDMALKTGGPAPAVGWITGMEARGDGIWGRVEWNATGQRLLGERAYRQISPAFAHTKKLQVTRVVRASLTNAGNLPLATLHTHEHSLGDDSMDLVKLRAALGLSADADEAAILAAATAAQAVVATHSQQLGSIAKAAGVAEAADAETIVTALHTVRATAGDTTRMAGEIVSLQTQLSTLSGERARERATAAIRKAQEDGKPITPALAERFIARHMQDPKGVEEELALLPSLHTSQFPRGAIGPAPSEVMLTPEDRQVARAMGVDPNDLLKTKKARLGMPA